MFYGNTCWVFCFIFSPFLISSFLFAFFLLFSLLIDHTGNGSDSFLRKLHPLPVCMPLYSPEPPLFFFLSMFGRLGVELLEGWWSCVSARSPRSLLMRLSGLMYESDKLQENHKIQLVPVSQKKKKALVLLLIGQFSVTITKKFTSNKQNKITQRFF